MKTIKLSKGFFAYVDDEDYEKINKFKWNYSRGYAIRAINKDGKKTTIKMHREILGHIEGYEIDHINRDRLDNQKSNLRFVTRSQNIMNSSKRLNCSSIYKGVYLNKPLKKYMSYIVLDGKLKYLGVFEKEIDAAISYNNAASKYFGEYANLNIIKKVGE